MATNYNVSNPADDETIANGPGVIRVNQEALKNDGIVNAGTVNGLTTGNLSGNIPVSNGNVNANLNAEKLQGKTPADFAPAGWIPPVATQSSNGSLSNTDKQKLDGIAANAEVNQNAFSNVLVGSTTVQADSKTDTLEIASGANIMVTPDATNDRLTIAVTGKVPSAAAADTATNASNADTVDNKHASDFAQSANNGQFYVDGNISSFYPIVFAVSTPWGAMNSGSPPNKLYVWRHTHVDSEFKGSLELSVEGVSNGWGAESAYVICNNQYSTGNSAVSWHGFAADVGIGNTNDCFIVWLRGSTTYNWAVVAPAGSTTSVDYAATSKTYNNDTYSIQTVISLPMGLSYGNKIPIVLGNDSRLTDARPANGGNAATLEGHPSGDFVKNDIVTYSAITNAIVHCGLKDVLNIGGGFNILPIWDNKGVAQLGNFYGIGGGYDGSQFWTGLFANGGGVLRTLSNGIVQSRNGDGNGSWVNLATVDQLSGIVAASLGQKGYAKFADGLILQWGSDNHATTNTVTFPVAFPNNVFSVVIQEKTYGHVGFNNVAPTTNGFYWHDYNWGEPNGIFWFAVGI